MPPARGLDFGKGMLVALFAFGALLFAGTFAIDGSVAAGMDPGPVFVPRAFSGALMLFCGLAFGLSKSNAGAAVRTDPLIFGAMFVGFAYVIALPRVGFGVATAAMVAVILFAMRAGALWRILLFAIALTAAIYLIFERLMTVGLPAGPWGF